MTEQPTDPEDRDTETKTRAEQEGGDEVNQKDEVNQHAATLRKRGAVARPQAENPAAVEPRIAPDQ